MLTCILGCLCMLMWHWYPALCWEFPRPCFCSGFAMIASLLFRAIGQVCIICICYVGVCIEGCIEFIAIMLLHLFWIWLSMVYCLWLHWLHGQNSSDGFFPIHVSCWRLLSLDVAVLVSVLERFWWQRLWGIMPYRLVAPYISSWSLILLVGSLLLGQQ